MADYMFLLYDDPTAFEDCSPEELQQLIQKYSAWQDRLVADGRLVAGNKLTDGEGRVLRSEGGKVRVLDGPYSEAKEIIGGFFTVRADSYEHAMELAQSGPHLELGGTIEIREIDVH